MPTLQDLREKQANVWSQMCALMDERGGAAGLSAEDATTYDAMEAELDGLINQIERGERHEKTTKALNGVDRSSLFAGPGRDEDADEQAVYDRVFATWVRSGVLDMTPEDRKVLQAAYQADSSIRNAAGISTGAAGGYLVPPAWRDKLVEVMKYFGPMLQVAEVIHTDTGADLPWGTNDDTGNIGALITENTAITEQDVTLGTDLLKSYMYTSRLVRVSYQLMQDVPDFDTWLIRKLGERLGRVYNLHTTIGTGSGQPQGIVTGGTVGATGTGSFGSTGGLAYDNLVDLMESIDPAYGNVGDLEFMGHQTVRKAFRKLKDGNGRPLWEPSLQAGVPSTVLGQPFRINNDMPTFAAGSKSLIYGNFREAYVIRIVRDITTIRLSERYAEYLQNGFFAFGRMDAKVQNTNAYRVFQATATA